MPYADLPVTRAMQPLKLKEYLATGRPVVVRDLPATRPGPIASTWPTPRGFSAWPFGARLATGLPANQRTARARLAGEAWAAKAQDVRAVVSASRTPRRRSLSSPQAALS